MYIERGLLLIPVPVVLFFGGDDDGAVFGFPAI